MKKLLTALVAVAFTLSAPMAMARKERPDKEKREKKERARERDKEKKNIAHPGGGTDNKLPTPSKHGKKAPRKAEE
jgi:Ni/Co efflux regulator RcnB